MNRQQRRKKEREYKKDINFLEKLTPAQLKKVDEVARKVASIKMDQFSSLLDRSMSAALIEEGWCLDEIDRVQNVMTELLLEDTKKSEALEKENVDMLKIENDVREKIEELLDKGVTKKQAISTLEYKFPKFSKSMLLNAYQKIKEEKGLVKSPVDKQDIADFFNEHASKYNAEQMVTKVMQQYGYTESTAKTYYHKWKKEYMSCPNGVCEIPSIPVSEEVSEEVKVNTEKIIEAVKEAQGIETTGLKVIEEEVVKIIKVEGTNGTYTAKTGKGVILIKENAQISFSSVEELDEWTREFREVFKMLG